MPREAQLLFLPGHHLMLLLLLDWHQLLNTLAAGMLAGTINAS